MGHQVGLCGTAFMLNNIDCVRCEDCSEVTVGP